MPTQELLTARVLLRMPSAASPSGTTRSCSSRADAGDTWERKHYAPEAQQPLLDVLCGGDGHGDRRRRVRRVLLSADCGATWAGAQVRRRSRCRAAPRSRRSGRRRVRRRGPRRRSHLNRIVGGLRLRASTSPREAGHLYRSDDAGETWVELPSPYEGSFFGVLPLDGESLLAYGLRGHLFRSDDGGATLAQIETGTVAMLNDAVRAAGRRRRGRRALGRGARAAATAARRFELSQQGDRKGLSALRWRRRATADSIVTVGEGGVKRHPQTRRERRAVSSADVSLAAARAAHLRAPRARSSSLFALVTSRSLWLAVRGLRIDASFTKQLPIAARVHADVPRARASRSSAAPTAC